MWITMLDGQYQTGTRFEERTEYFELIPSHVFLQAIPWTTLVPPPNLLFNINMNAHVRQNFKSDIISTSDHC